MDVSLYFLLASQRFNALDFEIGMNKKRQFRRKGFTLVELMGAVLISMTIILMLYKVFDKVQSVFVISQTRARAMEQGRIGMDMLVRDFKALSAAGLNDLNGSVPNIHWMDRGNETMLSIDPAVATEPGGQRLFWHHCWFFTNDEDWRYVDYKFGSRENYKLTPYQVPMIDANKSASPVGALWVYRSRAVPRAELLTELEDHKILQGADPGDEELDEPVGYARVIDGVVSFRVRAANPRIPFWLEDEPAEPYTGQNEVLTIGRDEIEGMGKLAPLYVEVELAVVSEKLVAEMEEHSIVKRTVGMEDQEIYDIKVEFLEENLDRVYFYKQLIRIQEN